VIAAAATTPWNGQAAYLATFGSPSIGCERFPCLRQGRDLPANCDLCGGLWIARDGATLAVCAAFVLAVDCAADFAAHLNDKVGENNFCHVVCFAPGSMPRQVEQKFSKKPAQIRLLDKSSPEKSKRHSKRLFSFRAAVGILSPGEPLRGVSGTSAGVFGARSAPGEAGFLGAFGGPLFFFTGKRFFRCRPGRGGRGSEK